MSATDHALAGVADAGRWATRHSLGYMVATVKPMTACPSPNVGHEHHRHLRWAVCLPACSPTTPHSDCVLPQSGCHLPKLHILPRIAKLQTWGLQTIDLAHTHIFG
ncbi:hypothetical protein TOPH_00084 [Tolypocladium ophioglossoides CBS 100239]|uniref:Uncharacterized protein n=1 Tax=Tolypocladium ophioglossoides (strain CBS 100239) TaxID=1163406 RepID=A0A0L0NKJ8_TOLOC|nr:hypothetical protein TOPH_00084 [Tolypocladium ophioglossoides CBS 100239]